MFDGIPVAEIVLSPEEAKAVAEQLLIQALVATHRRLRHTSKLDHCPF